MLRPSAYALVLVLLLACFLIPIWTDAPAQAQGGSSMPPPAAREARAAEFRFFARSAYEIAAEPCDFSPDLKRKSVLASELGALADFERSGPSADLQSQLQVARDDAAYAVTVKPRDCSPEALALLSPAQTRIELDRAALREMLARMRVLAPTLSGEPSLHSPPTSPQDAEFRYLARRVTMIVSPVCPFSRKKDRIDTLAESRELVTRLRNRVRPTRFEAQFATAEADEWFYRSTRVTECQTPDGPMTPELVRRAAAEVKTAVTRMEAIAGTELGRRP